MRKVSQVAVSLLFAAGAGCGRAHDLQEGPYVITIAPDGVFRDDCGLADAGAEMQAQFTSYGDDVRLAFVQQDSSNCLQLELVGQFQLNNQSFFADGTASNPPLTANGQLCQVNFVQFHLDGDTLNSSSFSWRHAHQLPRLQSGGVQLSVLVQLPGGALYAARLSPSAHGVLVTSEGPMAEATSSEIFSVSHEGRVFPPPPEFQKKALIRSLQEYQKLYDEAAKDPDAYWAARAKEEIYWKTPFQTVLEWKPPNAKWFLGGTTNLCYNALDRHLGEVRRQDGHPLRGGAG